MPRLADIAVPVPLSHAFTYEVPDSFNGTLRVMALVVEPSAVGMAERKLIVRGDYVISPSAPLAVAPGDQFELTASVANNVEKSFRSPLADEYV